MRLSLLTAVLGLSLALPTAQAALFSEPPWQALLDAGRADEMERQALTRLREKPGDLQASAALALAQIDLADHKRQEQGLRSMQDCVDNKPDEALCPYVLASLMTVQASNGGALKALSLAGRIKSNFLRALSLKPDMIEARSALQQYYLIVPAIAGGGAAKARELEAEVRSSQPDYARLMRARAAATEKNWALMEKELRSISPSADEGLRAELRLAWGLLAKELIDQKQYPRARALLEQLQKDQPNHALAAYGLGRMYTAMEQFDEAIRQFERARALDGAEQLPLDHRIGVALQAKGEKALARAAFERYLQNRRASPNNVEDCRRRLAELGPAL
ncbi:tetratricopeptide repeat protein [Paucibacter sp. APW11]|uniref:Tetratricopeptide repeat protein n=1 Tax=Roseateles aquae TaxID=3077235 RepID=A0ABU3P8Z5_9BURK|nr:tetratricopeptide repeat protein [Paucibacter sp. APW11]MDT8999055.1 tetratricopeptide repeat protein [Paucibacter sp. APW11]